jgi:hypothetical protein
MRNCVSDDAKGRKWKGKWQAARLLERRWKREEKGTGWEVDGIGSEALKLNTVF